MRCVFALLLPALALGGDPPPKAEESRAAALLRQMGSIRLLAEPDDVLLERELALILGRGGPRRGARRSGLADDALRSALARRDAYGAVRQPELDRFIELEKELVAAKPPATSAELAAAIRRHEGNPLLLLTASRILVDLHGEREIKAVIPALNRVDGSAFPVELNTLALKLAGAADRMELVPFFSKLLALPGHGAPLDEKNLVTPEQSRFLVLAGAGEAGEAAVLRNLGSKDPLVRRNAAALAGSLLARGARGGLREICRGGKDEADVTALLFALRSLALLLDYEAVGVIEPLTAHPVPEARASALSALGELARPRSLGRILASTDDRHYRVRESAVLALTRYVDRAEAVRRLSALAEKDPLSAIRQDAVALLALSPLHSATAAIERLYKAVGEDAVMRKAIESAMREQVPRVARGTLTPQFGLYDEKGALLTKDSAPDAGARLRQAVLAEEGPSASLIAALAPGLGAEDVPVLLKARERVARRAKLDVVLEEINSINGVIRSIHAR